MPPQTFNTEERAVPLKDGPQSSALTTSQHSYSTVALCLCTLTHAYLLISVFPYAGFMAIDLIEDANEENAGSYAGFIAASFMAGRSLTAYAWGKWADVYGRTTVLYASLLSSCVFTLAFGLAPSFRWALVFRFLLGMGNGLLGTVKTTVSEITEGNKKLETRGMGLVMGMWGWGFLFSPALSGALAEPVRQYPNSELVRSFQGILAAYPFLLPNLVGALFCFATTFATFAFVHETLPEEKRRTPKRIPADIVAWWKEFFVNTVLKRNKKPEEIPLTATTTQDVVSYHTNDKKSNEEAHHNHERTTDDEMHDAAMVHTESCSFLSTAADRVDLPTATQCMEESQEEATIASLWEKESTRSHLLLYWLYSFLSISLDEAFPLFCMSKTAGLSLTEKSIGSILSLSGLIFAICQYFIFATVVNKVGVYSSIRITSVVLIPVFLLFPIAIWLNTKTADGELSWRVFTFLGCLQAVYRVLSSVFFSSLSMAVNRSVPAHQRGTMNGLSVLGGSVTKALGPAFSGVMVAFCVASGIFEPHVGIMVVFSTFSVICVSVAYSSFYYLKEDTKQPAER
jgi:MFS family permease